MKPIISGRIIVTRYAEAVSDGVLLHSITVVGATQILAVTTCFIPLAKLYEDDNETWHLL